MICSLMEWVLCVSRRKYGMTCIYEFECLTRRREHEPWKAGRPGSVPSLVLGPFAAYPNEHPIQILYVPRAAATYAANKTRLEIEQWYSRLRSHSCLHCLLTAHSGTPGPRMPHSWLAFVQRTGEQRTEMSTLLHDSYRPC